MGRIAKNQINFFRGTVFICTTKCVFLFFRRVTGNQLYNIGKHFSVLTDFQGGYFSKKKTHIKKDQPCEQGHQIPNKKIFKDLHAAK